MNTQGLAVAVRRFRVPWDADVPRSEHSYTGPPCRLKWGRNLNDGVASIRLGPTTRTTIRGWQRNLHKASGPAVRAPAQSSNAIFQIDIAPSSLASAPRTPFPSSTSDDESTHTATRNQFELIPTATALMIYANSMQRAMPAQLDIDPRGS